MKHIKALTDSELLNQTRLLVSRERELTTELLWHLREVERRRLFAEQGYSSLFDYVRRGLGYCEASADRRISAMRLLREHPEIEPALKSGALSLSNASALQHFFKCDKHLAALAPELAKPEKSRPISATQTEIRFTAHQELMRKLEKLKGLLSHRNPNPSYAELFEMLAELALTKLDPEKKAEKKQADQIAGKPASPTPPAEVRPAPVRSRHIPHALRRTVWGRDQGQCTYVNEQSGVRCDSKHLLEVHHIQDFSLGGEHTQENLTLRCRTHNLHAALQTHGAAMMNQYLRE